MAAPANGAPVQEGTAGATGRAAVFIGRPAVRAYLVSGAVYLAVSAVLWWHVWSSHPSATATCGCGDPALFLWFLEWPAYAITHAHNLFYSTALFHPGGIDLLSNTSVLAIGVPLAPVTWIWGPVATLNVASTLAPVLSALAAFWCIRRWVRWAPAAFVGGLLFGFSPFVLQNLAYAHLMTASLVCLPLILACLDELLVRQRHRAPRVGLALGLVVVVEFFISTEVLVIVIISSVAGVVMLATYRCAVDRADVAARARRALPGLAVTAGVCVVLLAYPTWFALAGPAHLSGRLWPNIPVIGGYTVGSFVQAQSGSGRSLLYDIGGYLGTPLPSSSYLGWGLLAVLAGGLVAWRHDRRLWFFGAAAAVTAVLSLGERKHQWVPWQLFDRIPVLDNVVEQRFVAVSYLAMAVMLAVLVDRLRALELPETSLGAPWTAGARRLLPAAAGCAAMAVALGPIVAAELPALPYATRPVGVPPWFTEQAPRLPAGQVLLAYPAPFSGIQSSMAWQSIDRLRFAQAGGGGPQGTPDRAGAERPGFLALASLAFGFAPPPTGTPSQLSDVRRALRGWQVTMVVIPDQPGLPTVLRGHNPSYAAGFMTAALGRPPTFQDDAWVWDSAALNEPALRLGADTLEICTVSAARAHRSGDAVPACVLRAAVQRARAERRDGAGSAGSARLALSGALTPSGARPGPAAAAGAPAPGR
jgi:hypothetical protein